MPEEKMFSVDVYINKNIISNVELKATDEASARRTVGNMINLKVGKPKSIHPERKDKKDVQ